jgi:hypothetical protein
MRDYGTCVRCCLNSGHILTGEGSNETRASLSKASRKGRETAIVRRIRYGSTEPYSPNPDLDYPPQLAVGHVDDEEPKLGTLGEGRSRTASMPRLAASIHARQSAEVFDKGRAAYRGDAPARCLEKLIRLRVDRCYRDNRPSRLVRALAPTAAHQNLAASLSAYSEPRPAMPWCGYRRCRAMSAIGGKAENMCSF